MKERSVVGHIIDEPGTYDEEGNELTSPTFREGFHVNMLELLQPLAQFQVFPAAPQRVYAGAETIFLRFEDEAEWDSYKWVLDL